MSWNSGQSRIYWHFGSWFSYAVKTILWYSSQKLSTKFGEIVITALKVHYPISKMRVVRASLVTLPMTPVVMAELRNQLRWMLRHVRVCKHVAGGRRLQCTVISLSLHVEQEFNLTSSVTPSPMRCMSVWIMHR